MSSYDKYTSMISKLIIGDEEMVNLCELAKCTVLKTEDKKEI